MYCILLTSGQVRQVNRVTSADQCPNAVNLPTGSPSNGTILVVEPSDMPLNPFWISTADAAVITGAIVTLWLGAWAVRAARKALDPD